MNYVLTFILCDIKQSMTKRVWLYIILSNQKREKSSTELNGLGWVTENGTTIIKIIPQRDTVCVICDISQFVEKQLHKTTHNHKALSNLQMLQTIQE